MFNRHIQKHISRNIYVASLRFDWRTHVPSPVNFTSFFPCHAHLHTVRMLTLAIMSSSTPQWLFYALSSGGCAALNGVFAKLTTTELTTTWATGISHLFGFDEPSRIVEVLVRSVWLFQYAGILVKCTSADGVISSSS